MPQFNLSEIKKKIDTALEETNTAIAVFDADGTLWNVDVGVGFFHYQIDNNLLPQITKESLSQHQSQYEDLKTRHKALLWLAQINKGVEFLKFKTWAKDFAKHISPIPFIPEQVELIKYLQSKNVKIFVVTASLKWVAEEAVASLGIPPEQCIGVHTEVHNGVITDIQSGEVTWGDKKLVELLKQNSGLKPILASGNSMGDLALLKNASHVALAISKTPQEGHSEENHMSEQSLLSIAKKNDWFWLE